MLGADQACPTARLGRLRHKVAIRWRIGFLQERTPRFPSYHGRAPPLDDPCWPQREPAVARDTPPGATLSQHAGARSHPTPPRSPTERSAIAVQPVRESTGIGA